MRKGFIIDLDKYCVTREEAMDIVRNVAYEEGFNIRPIDENHMVLERLERKVQPGPGMVDTLRPGRVAAREMGLDVSQESISYADFCAAGLEMIVACTGCMMTMVLLSPTCYVDELDQTWCVTCLGLDERVL